MAQIELPPGGSSFVGYAESFDGEPPHRSLAQTLGVSARSVEATAAWLLSELGGDAPLASSADQLALNIRAFACYQDLMEVTIGHDSPVINRHYCYYEAFSYLREIGLCILHGNVLASLTLVRPFIELSVLHLYWRAKDDGYKHFYAWFEGTSEKPPFKNVLDDLAQRLGASVPSGRARIARLRESVTAQYKLACSYNHTPKLGESLTVLSGGGQVHSVEATATALAQINLTIRQILYLYVAAYPIVLFPRDVTSRFGYGGGPVGIFAYQELSALNEAAIGTANAAALRKLFSGHSDVLSRLGWFDSHPALDADRLAESWLRFLKQFPGPSAHTGHRAREAIARAQTRAFSWAINYIGERREWAPEEDAKLERLSRFLMDW